MDSKEQTPSVIENGGKPMPTITQIARPFFTNSEISYMHSLTIDESKKLQYNQTKHQIFQLLFQVIKQLKFPLRVLATAMSYYQRYYLFNKFEMPNNGEDFERDPYIVAITSLFLASKNEDCIKKLKDIQNVVNKIRDIDEGKLIMNGSGSSNSTSSSGGGGGGGGSSGNNEPVPLFEVQRKFILSTEFKLLQLIKFDFSNGSNHLSIKTSVDNLLTQFCKQLDINYRMSILAWFISFDIMSTPLCLVIPPHCISLAIIIITLNLKPQEIKLSHHELGEEDDDTRLSEILDSIDSEKDFKCPEVLVNEGIIYILDYYIHQYSHSILNNYLPPIDKQIGKEQIFKFMELKEKFNDLKILNETSCTGTLNRTDDYLLRWDFSISSKGAARFMLSNKRRRFNKELEIHQDA
ncbi:CTK2 [[Candida] subhashii]|uniref:CTK2 n=1 Tax=[Candida] subhashii TaxID=561895 RepID=A0A8J5QHH2_9ASCO|nr:CTK2 [[Candida] subhashii]KAG7661286.1 CTK2 [[Candida] subhashii]